MKKIFRKYGAIILLNMLSLVQLLMLILAGREKVVDPHSLPTNPIEAVPTFLFILIIDAVYFYFLKKYGLPPEKMKNV